MRNRISIVGIAIAMLLIMIACIAVPASAMTIADDENYVDVTLTYTGSEAGWQNQFGYGNVILGDNKITPVGTTFNLGQFTPGQELVVTDTVLQPYTVNHAAETHQVFVEATYKDVLVPATYKTVVDVPAHTEYQFYKYVLFWKVYQDDGKWYDSLSARKSGYNHENCRCVPATYKTVVDVPEHTISVVDVPEHYITVVDVPAWSETKYNTLFYDSNSANARVTGSNGNFNVNFEDTPGLGDRDYNDMRVTVAMVPSLMDGSITVNVVDDAPNMPLLSTITFTTPGGKTTTVDDVSTYKFDLSKAAQGTYTASAVSDDPDKSNVGNTGSATVDFHGGYDYVVTIYLHWVAPHVDPAPQFNYALYANTETGVGYMAVMFGEHATEDDYTAASQELGVSFGPQNVDLLKLNGIANPVTLPTTTGVWIFMDGHTQPTIDFTPKFGYWLPSA